MKLLFLSALVALALSHLLEAAHKDALDAKWELFKIAHAKNYQLDTEEQERKEVFLKNLKFIAEHNDRYEKKLVSFTVGINKYADLTTHEFAAMMNGYNQLDRTQRTGDPFDASQSHLPESVDWRLKGAVTRVKDQKQCGACWAFSATGSLEGQHFLRKGKLVSLSEQNLIDCSKNDYNAGCNGGTMDAAFKYVKKNKGIDTEQSYPYEAKDGKCRYNPNNNVYTDYGYVDIPEGSEAALKKAVAKVGPISVAIDAGLDSFQLYRSGVYNDLNCSSTDLNHGVLVVGYGTAKEGGDYWLMKNSWGTHWGMNGYFLLARNQNNTCGIATTASYPKVK